MTTASKHRDYDPKDERHQKRLLRSAIRVDDFENWQENAIFEGVLIKRISVRVDLTEISPYLCVITADRDNKPEVTFHAGSTLLGAMSALMEKVMRGDAKWRKDDYAK